MNANVCYLCVERGVQQRAVEQKNKCCDHDHVTGLYIGAACRACNLARAMKKQYIPLLFFHNGKNYDMHLVVKEITKKKKYGCVFDGIPENGQKLLSLTIKRYHPDERRRHHFENKKTMCHIRVVDSFGFLLSSLENYTEALKAKNPDNLKLSFPTTYKILNKYCGCSDEQITLALQKNAYPHLWFTDFTKFERPISDLDDLFANNRYEAFTEDVSEAYKQKFERMKGVYYTVRDAFGFTNCEAVL